MSNEEIRHEEISQAVLGAVTAHLNGELDLAANVLVDVSVASDDAGAVMGMLLAYAGNVVKLFARSMGVDPQLAWEAILRAERAVEAEEEQS